MKINNKPQHNKPRKTADINLCITALGLATSVGHDHKTACASLRADFKRPRRLKNYYVETREGFEDYVDGLVTGHPILDGDPNDRVTRMFTVLGMALKDLAEDFEDEHFLEETPLYLALPGRERLSMNEEDIHDHVLAHSPVVFEKDKCRVYQTGHAGMVLALCDAAKNFENGLCQRVIIAGTDSLISFEDLSRYDEQYRLKTSINPDGLMPGEAASAFLVETLKSAEQRNASIRCSVLAVASSMDDQPFLSGKPPVGTGFTNAIRAVSDQEKDPPLAVDAVITDLNGESYRFSEWGLLQARIIGQIHGKKNLICPARNIGDTGAASPGVSLAIAVRSMERGYLADELSEQTGKALILCGSDTGERGAVVVGEWMKKEEAL